MDLTQVVPHVVYSLTYSSKHFLLIFDLKLLCSGTFPAWEYVRHRDKEEE